MHPEEIENIRRILPEEMPFLYYADRQSPWLLAQSMASEAKVADLRRTPCAKLLDRPLVRPLVAECGGTLRQRDLLALGNAERAPRLGGISAAGWRALEPVFAADWQDYVLSFTSWGTVSRDWQWQQISRRGGNLVVQLGFPGEHGLLFRNSYQPGDRQKFEYFGHPIRRDGRATLAWARLDIDLETGTALIEEIQSDWLRNVTWEGRRLVDHEPAQSRALKNHRRYEAQLSARYGRDWAKVMMLAVLALLRDEFACREVWIHQPRAGAALKGIRGGLPPVSLYTSLPRAFCFEPAREVPPFLRRSRRRVMARLRKAREPLFWRLGFPGPPAV